MKRVKYSQTQFLECIDKVEHSDFKKDHEDVLELLINLADGKLVFDSKSILELDMDLIDRLNDLITDALLGHGDDKNPLSEVIMNSKLKVLLDIMKIKESCVEDKDFF